VIVLDNGGRRDVTVWGGILTLRARGLGVRAAVIHGACRDAEWIRALGFPVFAREPTMRTGKDRARVVEVGGPVSLGTAGVSPGDVVIADADGVVVVPREREREILAMARRIEAAERAIERAVLAGGRLDAARREHGYHGLQHAARSDRRPADPAEDALAASAAVPGTAAVSDVLGAGCVLSAGLRRLSGSGVVAGPAAVAVCAGDSNLPLHRAIEAAEPGAFLVATTDPSLSRGWWGELMTRAAIRRGIAGLVLHGHVRDLSEIRSLGFPVWAVGACPTGAGKGDDGAGETSAREPVPVAGVRASSGDWIVADDDGVCAIPRDSRRAVLEAARARLHAESDLRLRVLAGERLLDGLLAARHGS
jgi:regulator of RNase E activity RraA